MTTQNILTADVLDIVFENRNKAYGAYILRKYYDKRLAQSLGITLLIAATFCLLSFRFGKKPTANNGKTKGEVVIKTYEIKPNEEKKEIEKPKEKLSEVVKQPEKPFETFKNKEIVIVADDAALDKDTVVSQSLLDTRANGDETKPGEKGGQNLGKTNIITDPGEGGDTKGTEVTEVNNPIDNPDIPPSYPGGIEALQNFLRRNLRTPDELESGQTASVKIKFIVGHDGEMFGYEVIQSAGDVFDKEVIRVLKKMPDWIPGRYKERNVTAYYVIPVRFEGIE